ncbi:glyoxal oxidase N-terminus-domain-containing protein [Mycena floridula]|nr:glyoxal oxidase N-terminus-domain-containing protein [Mycena floridula]
MASAFSIARRHGSATKIFDQLLRPPSARGIQALELMVVSQKLAIMFDRAADTINKHSAWGALWDFTRNQATPLDAVTNTFYASGSFLSNGTMVSVVENRTIDPDGDGYMGIRIFEPCDDRNGLGYTLFKDPENFNLAAMRWYPSSLRIFDGSLKLKQSDSSRHPKRHKGRQSFHGTPILLPLSPHYISEVLVCGGTATSDTIGPLNLFSRSSFQSMYTYDPDRLTPERIAKGWELDHMLKPQVLPEMVLVPNAKVIIVNGAQTGYLGYMSVSGPVSNDSNADYPALDQYFLPVAFYSSSRLMFLEAALSQHQTVLTVKAPPNNRIYSWSSISDHHSRRCYQCWTGASPPVPDQGVRL